MVKIGIFEKCAFLPKMHPALVFLTLSEPHNSGSRGNRYYGVTSGGVSKTCIFAKKGSCTRVFPNFRDSQPRIQKESVLKWGLENVHFCQKSVLHSHFYPLHSCFYQFPGLTIPGPGRIGIRGVQKMCIFDKKRVLHSHFYPLHSHFYPLHSCFSTKRDPGTVFPQILQIPVSDTHSHVGAGSEFRVRGDSFPSKECDIRYFLCFSEDIALRFRRNAKPMRFRAECDHIKDVGGLPRSVTGRPDRF